jgi:hypothetical protein
MGLKMKFFLNRNMKRLGGWQVFPKVRTYFASIFNLLVRIFQTLGNEGIVLEEDLNLIGD